MLRQSVASATAGPDMLASAIKYFAHSDGWKATLLLGTLPKILLYHNIIDNITAGTDAPAYSVIILRLKELNDRTIQRKTKKRDSQKASKQTHTITDTEQNTWTDCFLTSIDETTSAQEGW